jgi:hypothetical protein
MSFLLGNGVDMLSQFSDFLLVELNTRERDLLPVMVRS